MIISESTTPPFLGSRLPDLYVEVSVVPQGATGHKDPVSIEKLLHGSGSSSSSTGAGRKGKQASNELGRMTVPRSKSKLLLSQHKSDTSKLDIGST